MSDSCPIQLTWILVRPKVKYYGAYPAGFLGRARNLFNIAPSEPLLHVCSGKVSEYQGPHGGILYPGWGPNDKTLDLDPALCPDFCQDARLPFPALTAWKADGTEVKMKWPGILIDPPYTEKDAESYAPGAQCYPEPALLLKNAFEALQPGRRVGLLHYEWARPPKEHKLVAVAHVLMGYGNRSRIFSVYEKPL